jgi:uncharacterized protein
MTEIAQEMTLKEQFQEGLERGELLLQSCHSCGRLNMYPRYACPFCQSRDLGWKPAHGTGVLYSFTIVRLVPPRGFEDDLPYALGVAKLDEGVQLSVRLEPTSEHDFTGYDCDVPVAFRPELSKSIGRGPVAWFGLRGPE